MSSNSKSTATEEKQETVGLEAKDKKETSVSEAAEKASDWIFDHLPATGGDIDFTRLELERRIQRAIDTACEIERDKIFCPTLETAIRMVGAHIHQQGKFYIEIAVDPKTKEVASTFEPTLPDEAMRAQGSDTERVIAALKRLATPLAFVAIPCVIPDDDMGRELKARMKFAKKELNAARGPSPKSQQADLEEH